MEINGLQPSNIYKAFMESPVRSGSSKGTEVDTVSTDRVEISSQSADLNAARELARKSYIAKDLAGTDKEHSEHFESVKNLLASGKYSVDSKDVAKSILRGKSVGE